MMSKLKLTELKPMPLIVTQYKPNPKHLLSPSSKPTASACGILCFFSWLTTVLSSARLRLGLGLQPEPPLAPSHRATLLQSASPTVNPHPLRSLSLTDQIRFDLFFGSVPASSIKSSKASCAVASLPLFNASVNVVIIAGKRSWNRSRSDELDRH
uniref:Uncharacterized protein n=1 Tax=Fagus sylvatica TaxID=28930 RepID=A0A2N9IH38_FAGSY